MDNIHKESAGDVNQLSVCFLTRETNGTLAFRVCKASELTLFLYPCNVADVILSRQHHDDDRIHARKFNSVCTFNLL